jgi:hypothetical protein
MRRAMLECRGLRRYRRVRCASTWISTAGLRVSYRAWRQGAAHAISKCAVD